MLASGRLRYRVAIQAEVTTDNNQGGRSRTWSTISTVRAEIVGVSGGEALRAKLEKVSDQLWKVTIRKCAVTTKHRLLWDGKVLDIQLIVPDPEAPFSGLVLTCESGKLSA